MLSIEEVKRILNNPNLSDKEAEEIRDGFRVLAELIFEQWQEDRKRKTASSGIQNSNSSLI